ncbi:DUF655 domain-containing protein [Candidatus Nitrosotenuis aquarius]|uniref:DUF655 domain-containing protein n=1 Tax=Candidatus Nitrosotenuis aquarius TaxID=1846278 RepID=UPI000C1E1694|nr:DUF655 domain-containing protein [Candidatus Nitrosotenuis aquarius]
MERSHVPPRKYEEYAYVLDYVTRGRATTVRGREGIIITAIGEDRLTLLEVLGMEGTAFDIGERIYIGKEGRTKIQSVLGKLEHSHISAAAQSELKNVITSIVSNNEKRFVDYINNAQPLTPRIHALELIPGIGKTYMKTILEEREKTKFTSFADLQERVGLKEPMKHIIDRIMDEITGEVKVTLFVKK